MTGFAPRVSVVMGCYNGGSMLAPTVDGILAQRDLEFEFIIVDDGSTDGSTEVVDSYARRDSRIRVESRRGNEGLTRALIRGCELAQGEYIARQDVGDVSMSGRLRRQAEILDSRPDVVLASCSFRLVGPEGEILKEDVSLDGVSVTAALRDADPDRLTVPHHGSVMFRRAAYRAVGGYRECFYYAQDLDLWTRLAQEGAFEFAPEVLYEVRFHRGSISARFSERQRRLRELIAAAARRRGQGDSEGELLDEARELSRSVDGSATSSRAMAGADYFVGSCLLSRRDPAAARYLRRALRYRPFHGKAWAKLVLAYATRRSPAP